VSRRRTSRRRSSINEQPRSPLVSPKPGRRDPATDPRRASRPRRDAPLAEKRALSASMWSVSPDSERMQLVREVERDRPAGE
jgi:hypothetical protein